MMDWAMDKVRSVWAFFFSRDQRDGELHVTTPEQLVRARAEAHELLVADETLSETRSKEALFEEFVRINRANGVDPFNEDQAGRIGYEHSHLVPMQGDPYWSNGRVISRATIDRRFRKAAL